MTAVFCSKKETRCLRLWRTGYEQQQKEKTGRQRKHAVKKKSSGRTCCTGIELAWQLLLVATWCSLPVQHACATRIDPDLLPVEACCTFGVPRSLALKPGISEPVASVYGTDIEQQSLLQIVAKSIRHSDALGSAGQPTRGNRKQSIAPNANVIIHLCITTKLGKAREKTTKLQKRMNNLMCVPHKQGDKESRCHRNVNAHQEAASSPLENNCTLLHVHESPTQWEHSGDTLQPNNTCSNTGKALLLLPSTEGTLQGDGSLSLLQEGLTQDSSTSKGLDLDY